MPKGDALDRAIGSVDLTSAQTGTRFFINVAGPGEPKLEAEIVLPTPVTQTMLFHLFEKLAEWWRKDYEANHGIGPGIAVPPGIQRPGGN